MQLKGAVAKSAIPRMPMRRMRRSLRSMVSCVWRRRPTLADDGRNVTIKTAVFEDASGAYGAFTFYYSDEMGVETIGGRRLF